MGTVAMFHESLIYMYFVIGSHTTICQKCILDLVCNLGLHNQICDLDWLVTLPYDNF